MYVVQILPFFAIAIAGVHRGGHAAAQPGAGLVALDRASASRPHRAATLVVPRWYVGDRRALVTNDNAAYVRRRSTCAARCPTTPAPRSSSTTCSGSTASTPDTGPSNVIWFYKLDLDPAVAERLPDGWRDVDYIVSTPALRQDPELPADSVTRC